MYVAKTASIWREITDNISQLYQERLNSAMKYENYGLSLDAIHALAIANTFPQDLQDVMRKYPEAFVSEGSGYAAHYVINSLDGQHQITQTFNIFCPAKLPIPNGFSSWRGDKRVITDPQLLDIFQKRANAMTLVNNQQNAFLEKVSNVWSKVPSVNAFIKAWPPGAELLSMNTKERINKKRLSSEKRTKLALNDVDMSSISSELLMAKVLK